MPVYTVSITDPKSEKDFVDFLNSHTDIEAKENKAIEYDPNMYDKDGNFQRMNLAGPGLPVTDEYMAWRIEQSRNSLLAGKGMTLLELKENLAKRRKEVFHK
ncbi:MAG: hypothetical protein EAZ53_03515 [Bacteroidetes bacterium]|nr:MAG: hypothetical protein EAZ53_03515 [Bacteroidota bacterium]